MRAGRQDACEGAPRRPTREESGILVITVIEEAAFVVRRLTVRKEVRLRFVHSRDMFEQPVAVRRQKATVMREPSPGSTSFSPPHPAAGRQHSMTRTITALFDTHDAADRAARDLATRVGGVRGRIHDTTTAGELSSLGIPGEDLEVLREKVRRGGAVLHAEVPDDRFAAAAEVMEHAGAVDFDEQEATWRREGWTGATTAVPAAGARTGAATGTTTGTTTGATTGTTTGATTGATVGATGLRPGGEEVIPVIEEHLRVGKREVGHGRVRIRSYVVETPVQEQVTLHEERVQVERRPVDRPVGASDDVFRDKTIEATETSEEAVVAKEARVKEEVVVRKTEEERTQTVSDKVRQTKVEVDDERGRTGTTGPGTTPSRSADKG